MTILEVRINYVMGEAKRVASFFCSIFSATRKMELSKGVYNIFTIHLEFLSCHNDEMVLSYNSSLIELFIYQTNSA